MKLSLRQKDLHDRLAADPYFAGVDLIIEEDPAATTEQDAAYEKTFEAALTGDAKGIVVVLLAPFTSKLGEAKRGAISLRVMLPIAIIENKQVNRAAGGLGKPALEMVEHAIRVLLPAYEFNATPFGRPELANGLLAYFLVAEAVHVIRASA